MNSKNDFYVYEWFNTETGEVFYVGKGSRDRYKDVSKRNALFKEYYNTHSVKVRIVKDKLSEEEAFALEKEVTDKYKRIGQCQCNLAEAGKGGCSFVWTDEMRKYWSEYNPMKQEEQRERMRKHNPMYNPEIAKKTGARHKRAVVIDGVQYDGCVDAAEALGVCEYTVYTWCQRGYNTSGRPCRYADEPQKEYTLPKKGKAVIIDEKYYYETLKEAAQALGANDSSPLCKAIKKGKTYKGHTCRYANQQPN